MAIKLMIVESPNKVKTISKYLGDGYLIMSSVGHIVKLPSTGEFGLGIELETWTPKYAIDPKKRPIVKELIAAAKNAEEVLVATDLDREGEAIADNLVEFLKIEDKYKRITFNEITKSAILKAIENHGVVDYNLVDAQKTRRMMDRIIGYRITNLMKSKIKNSPQRPTAGRVQSIALKLVVDKENDIRAFKPVEYYTVSSEKYEAKMFFDKKQKEDFTQNTWIKPDDIEEIKSKIKGKLVVSEIKKSERNEKTYMPFKQAVLYKNAESMLGMSSRAIQSASQSLYEKGATSYPRTDSTRLSEVFIEQAQKHIEDKFGKEYVAKEIKGSSGDQDAHEAIRPTDAKMDPAFAIKKWKLDLREAKVYTLIYNRTIQSLMKVPRKAITRYILTDNGYTFSMTSSNVIFDGYYKLIGYNKSKEIPIMTKGDELIVEKYDVSQNFTKPPARYTEGSLINKLDEIGVGRPSTFQATIQKIIQRTYVDKKDRSLIPTEFGEIVLKMLIIGFPKIINESYTKEVEDHLDQISKGEREFKDTLDNFWAKFTESLEEATNKTVEVIMEHKYTGDDCSLCDDGKMIFRMSKKGQEFVGCNQFPKCKNTMIIVDGVVKPRPEPAAPEYTGEECTDCGKGKLVWKMSRKGQKFIACDTWPKCKFTKSDPNAPKPEKKKKTK